MVTVLKHIGFLAVAMSAAIFFSAFDKTFEETGIDGESDAITIAASNDVGTRSSLIGGSGTDRNNVTFTKGDALSVWAHRTTVHEVEYDNKYVKFQSYGNPYPDGSADFSGKISFTMNPDIYAMHPYQQDATCEMDGKGITMHVTIPRSRSL